MPYSCRRRGGKWRVVKADTGHVATNSSGTPLDGGGHKTEQACKRQIGAIEASEAAAPKKEPPRDK